MSVLLDSFHPARALTVKPGVLGLFMLLPGFLRVEYPVAMGTFEPVFGVLMLIPGFLRIEYPVTVPTLELMFGILVLIPGVFRVEFPVAIIALERSVLGVFMLLPRLVCGEPTVAIATFKGVVFDQDVLVEALLGVEHLGTLFTSIRVPGFLVLRSESSSEHHGA